MACVTFVRKAGTTGGWLDAPPRDLAGRRRCEMARMRCPRLAVADLGPASPIGVTYYLVLSSQFLWGNWRLVCNEPADCIAIITFPEGRR